MNDRNNIKDGTCPYCMNMVQLTESEKLTQYGQVIKTCPKCNQKFIDRRVNELSDKGIQKNDKRLIRKENWMSVIIGIIITVFAISSVDEPGFMRSKTVLGISIALFLGPLFTIVGIFQCLSDIRNYKKRLDYLEVELQESKNRFMNPDYAKIYYTNIVQNKK